MTCKFYVMLICLSLWYRQLVACCDLHIGDSVCLSYTYDVSMLLYFSNWLTGGGGDVFSSHIFQYSFFVWLCIFSLVFFHF